MIYLSMNGCKLKQYEEMIKLVRKYQNVGLELQPEWENEGYIHFLEKYGDLIKHMGCTYKEPNIAASHFISDELYKLTFQTMKRTIESAAKLHSRFIAYHCNHSVLPKDEMTERKRIAMSRLKMFSRMSESYGVPMVVENTGLRSLGSMMFDEEEFIKLCKYTDYYVVLDLGYASANGWNIQRVMKELRHKILGYRLYEDDEMGIEEWSRGRKPYDQMSFWREYRQYTPYAELVLECDAQSVDWLEKISRKINRMMQETELGQNDLLEEVSYRG